MLRLRQRVKLIDDRHLKLSVARTILFACIFLVALLMVAGVVVFSCVHGTNIS